MGTQIVSRVMLISAMPTKKEVAAASGRCFEYATACAGAYAGGREGGKEGSGSLSGLRI